MTNRALVTGGAGSIAVGESIANPLKYYHNNTENSRVLISACMRAGIRRFIFSSTAAVYGANSPSPLNESAPTNPLNAYGRSKLMTEWILGDVARNSGLQYLALRYFNVAGADPTGRTGQVSVDATHLIKVCLETICGRRPQVEIFGDDYPTSDGTCIRDYIHVSDVADAHVAALGYLRRGGESMVANIGYGQGYSVREVIASAERVSENEIKTRVGPRRAGDAPITYADSTRIRRLLDWRPRYDDLDFIIKTALDWERGLSDDFKEP